MHGNLPELRRFSGECANNGCARRWLRYSAVFAALAVTLPAAVAPRQPNRRAAGTLYAWGDNQSGELGNGSLTPSSVPAPVMDLSGVVATAGGAGHSLVLTSDGKVWAWGNNAAGQLGNGSTTDSSTPVQVRNLSGVIAVAAGSYHSLALTSGGTVWAWGDNRNGQLGDGSQVNSSLPVQIFNGLPGLSGFVAIAAGGYYSMALTGQGLVYAWGDNSFGQLGKANYNDYSPPSLVNNLNGVVAIAAGFDHSLALTSDGHVWDWGDNRFAQLGNGTLGGSTAVPAQVGNLSGVVSVAGGYFHSLALTGDGQVWAWGDNGSGALGLGGTGNIFVPVQVSGISGVVAVAAGSGFSAAVKSNGQLWEWGNNSAGELGNGGTTDTGSPVPAPAGNLNGVIALACGVRHILAIQAQTTGDAWGYNSSGQLGNGGTTNSTVPVAVSHLTGVVSISGLGGHSMALTSDGKIWAWGYNGDGELGNGSTTPLSSGVPVQVGNFLCTNAANCVAAISAGGSHNLALTSDGKLWAWGDNDDGELGNGNNDPSSVPVQVSGFTCTNASNCVVAIAAGNYHSLALTSDGTVWAWGADDNGQLGDPDFPVSSNVPVPVGGSRSPLRFVIAIAAGTNSSLALAVDGTVLAWGDNNAGELGNGTQGSASNIPAPVSNLSGVAAIATGAYHDMALTSDGNVWAWGDNSYGELGYSTLPLSYSDVPRQVSNLSGVLAIAAGGTPSGNDHSLALSDNGQVWAWGDNTYGELGNGSTTNAGVPVQVSNLSGAVSIAGGSVDSLATALVVPFISGFALNGQSLRNNFSGLVGMQLTVGPLPLNVFSLGRVCVAGNSQTHTVKLVNASTKMDVPGASAQVNMANCSGGLFVYTDLASPVTLPPGTTYYLVSQEFGNGDFWYEHGAISAKAGASVIGAEYFDGANWILVDSANTSYVPPDMRYEIVQTAQTLQTPAFVLNYNLNNQGVRNNFPGFVGMSLTVGATPLNVISVGRVCVSGNTQSHVVKFVLASTGGDVPGGSAAVPMNGCMGGQFVFTPLGAPLTLQANTTYYLVSQEIFGGDYWYEQGPLTTKTDASVTNAIYSSDGTHWAQSVANSSYVPPNFQYSLLASGAVSVTVQTSIGGPSFVVDGITYTAPQIFAWAAGSQHSIATSSPQSAADQSRYVFTGWSDGGAISHMVSPAGNATFTAGFKQQYLLTTTSAPPAGGTILATPSSVDGYYDSNTFVQLQENANPGYVFFSWTGALVGISNPQTVPMSAARSVTANFQGASAASGFLTGYALNSPITRSNFPGFVGMILTVGANPLSVTSVGRICLAGNTGTHMVKFVDALSKADVAGASAFVPMAGCTPGQFAYNSLAIPVALNAGGTYYLASQEVNGGDKWYDQGLLSSRSDAQVIGSVYLTGTNWTQVMAPNMAYVPPDFKYMVLPPSPQPFVTSFNLNNRPLRSNFPGLVGMKITVGANNLSVSSLGRVCVAGNSQSHAVEFVNAVTLAVVLGSLTSVDMAGCTPGVFKYTTLATAITLSAGASYYLVSQETDGGDSWYDFAALTSTAAAQVNSSLYFYNGTWYPYSGPNTSYVPPNFLYQIAP